MVPADIKMSHRHTLAMFWLYLLTNVGKFDPRGNLVFLLKIGHQTDRRCLAFSLLHRFHGGTQLDEVRDSIRPGTKPFKFTFHD